MANLVAGSVTQQSPTAIGMCRLVFWLRLRVYFGVFVFVFVSIGMCRLVLWLRLRVYFGVFVFVFVSTVLPVLCISYVSPHVTLIGFLNAG